MYSVVHVAILFLHCDLSEQRLLFTSTLPPIESNFGKSGSMSVCKHFDILVARVDGRFRT
jgi:hypothetical protein